MAYTYIEWLITRSLFIYLSDKVVKNKEVLRILVRDVQKHEIT